ncbi:MAG TPA: hypothetical protein VKY80_11565 [Croceibacterium sp.]|nr:hypothetical protein [Croceibacterium sp.]
MVTRKALVALASAGLVFGSTAAAAAPAAADVRVASPVAEAEGLGGSWAWILALIIAAGVIGVIASDGDEEIPVSP